jgi:hypothetical protein
MQELVAELMKVWPQAARVKLGKHDVFRHHYETPAHKYEAIVIFLEGPRVLRLTARDSFDRRLALFLLNSATTRELPTLGSVKIRVHSVKFPRPWLFECLVVVPPRIAKSFAHQSARLRRATYWVVPAFAGEFKDRDDGKAFWHEIYRKDGWNVSVIRWDRTGKTEPSWD